MFAFAAFVFLLLAALGVNAGAVDFVLLGLAAWALHFAFDLYPWRR